MAIKEAIVNQFSKSLLTEHDRKNGVETKNINSTLITAALTKAFVNESCKSSGKVSKSQVIYRKLKEKSKPSIRECFQKQELKFLRRVKALSRNRKFTISFDTTKEPFYGDFSKAEDPLYLHHGKKADGSEFFYEFLTVAITSGYDNRQILDAVILPRGAYIEDYVSQMMLFVKEQLPIKVVLFDRGFSAWEVIEKLKQLKVHYLLFWRKQGDWYKEHLEKLNDGELCKVHRIKKYNKNKGYYKISSNFILVKQLEYEEKKFDWIFATNLNLKSAETYVKLYKRRWGIETIFRVTDDIRIYTTSTNSLVRYFLFIFTCFVYNIWKFSQMFLGEEFTLANFNVNMIAFMFKTGKIYPNHYDKFEFIFSRIT